MPKSLKEVIKDNINVPGLFQEVLDQVLEPALDKLVKSTPSKLDDALKAAIYPELSAALKAEVVELWGKLLKEVETVQPVPGPA